MMSFESSKQIHVVCAICCQCCPVHLRSQEKRAYNRLNHLGISMSQKRTLRKIRAMAKNYNSVMLSWKASIESHVATQSSIPEVRSVACSLPVATCVLPAFDKTNSDLNSFENSLSSSSSSHSVETEEGNDEMQDLSQKSFQVTGDNLDISIKTKYMSIDRRNKSLHWFNVIASNERVINADLATSRPRCSILSVPDTAFLPSVQENEKLREEFANFLWRGSWSNVCLLLLSLKTTCVSTSCTSFPRKQANSLNSIVRVSFSLMKTKTYFKF